MKTTCQWCTAETTNGLALCQRCQQKLSVSLVNVASYFADVDRIRPGERVKVRGAYQSAPPPPLSPAPDRTSEALDHVATVVFGWCQNLEDDRPGFTSALPMATERRCGWLESYVVSITTLPWAGECLREVRDCERMLKAILDRSDTGRYVGVCGNEIGRSENEGEVVSVSCPRHLYLPATTDWVVCPECGRTWNGSERQQSMIAMARDELAPIRVIASVVVQLVEGEASVERLTRRIEQWVRREKLSDYGVRVLDGRPRRVYRIDDVLKLVKPGSSENEAEAC